MEEQVVLVDATDEVLGLMGKMEAHQKGVLHRAISVFLFDRHGRMLLQQRAACKYHSPRLWTNACCSHPRENESYLAAAQRRVQEELGIAPELIQRFKFTYKADVGQGLWEHEMDQVFVGQYEGEFALNPDEVAEVRYVSLAELQAEINQKPDNFTEWFKIIWEDYQEEIIKFN
jgi:isopentenyl-diphosphate Delta-isomerase